MQCSSSEEYDYDGRFGGARLSPHLTGAAAADGGRVLPRVSSSEEEDKEDMSDTAPLSSSESESWGSDIDSDATPFESRRVFMCYLYLYGKARLSTRQYDAIREVENSFPGAERWPSQWRLRQIRDKLAAEEAEHQVVATQRTVPSRRGQPPRRLSDARIRFITFSQHVKRDFSDPVTARLFHDRGDAALGTVEAPAEVFQTRVARRPSFSNYRRGFRLRNTFFPLSSAVLVQITSTMKLSARLSSFGIAEDGDVALTEAAYTRTSPVHVGDFTVLACTDALAAVVGGSMRGYFTSSGVFCLRITLLGTVYIKHQVDNADVPRWKLLPTPDALRLQEPAATDRDSLPEKDPYRVCASWYSDEFSVGKRRRGSLDGHYSFYDVSLHLRTSSIRPLAYLPPGADPKPLVKAIMDDLIRAATDGVEVYDAYSKCDALVYIAPCVGIYDFPMEAKYADAVGPSGTEHCTSCNIVSKKCKGARKDQSRSSCDIFDVLDVRHMRIQERTMAVRSAIESSPSLSAKEKAAALLLNGISSQEESPLVDVWRARGPGSFDIHEHVIVAPSHLLYYGLTSSLLRLTFNNLNGRLKDDFLRMLRAMPVCGHGRSLLKHFEPDKLGGTTLSMSDYSVLLGTAPEAVADAYASDGTSTLDCPYLRALRLLRGFCNNLFYLPTEAADGAHAVRARPTVAEIQGAGLELMRMLKQLSITDGTWEKPKVHRLLELLHRTLPLVEIGPAVCETMLERFHLSAKREVESSNMSGPAGFALQRWKETELLSRVVQQPTRFGVVEEWMKDKNGEELTIVARTRFMSAAGRQRAVWRVQKELHVNQMSKSDCWTRLPEPGAPTCWVGASSLPSGFTVKHGSTVAALLPHGDLHAVNDVSAQADKRLKYFLVDAIASCAGNVWFAARLWEVDQEETLKTDGQPARVKLMSDSQVFLIRAENVTQQALVLEGHNGRSLFSKMSGFTFKRG